MDSINFMEHKRVIKIFLVMGLLIHSAIEYFASEVYLLNTGVFFLFYGLMFLLALPVLKNIFSTISENVFLSLMILWTVASLFWTSNLLETSLAVGSLLGMLLIAFYLVKMFSIEEVFELFVYFCLITILINAIALFFFPELSIYRDGHVHYGKWQGIYWHKNAFGIIFQFSIFILSLALYFKGTVNKWLLFISIFLSFLFLYNSESSTSWLAAIVCLILFAVKWLNTKKNIQWRWFFMAFFISSVFVVLYVDQLLMYLFGKSLAFTGRTGIWIKVVELIKQNILIGNGYYGFWYDMQHSLQKFGMIMSHNGYLEIMVFLGSIGFFLFLLMWGRALFLSAKLFFSKKMTLETTFPFIFLVSYSVQNTMESLFFLKMNVFTVIFIYFVLYLNRYFAKNERQ